MSTTDADNAAPLWNSGRLAFTICAFFAVNNLMLIKMNTNFALICMTKNGTVSKFEFRVGLFKVVDLIFSHALNLSGETKFKGTYCLHSFTDT